MDLMEAIKTRRSHRRFILDKPISDKKITSIIEAGTWAPSDCNLQGWNFIIVKSKQLRQKMVKEAGTNVRILKSSITIVICYDKFDPKIGLQGTSAAVQNMMLKATSIGIGSCWIASCGDRKKIKHILDIPEELNIASIVVFGYPKYKINNPPPRKPVNTITHLNKFNGKNLISFSHDPDKWTYSMISQYQYYYCRKTALGIKMEVSNNLELDLLKEKIPEVNGISLDLFSYDGLYLEFLKGKNQYVLDFNEQTSMYTRAASNNINKDIKPILFNKKIPIESNSVSLITCIFKIERLPEQFILILFKEVYRVLKKDGKFLIIFRNSFSLYSVLHKLIKLKFGDDIRKSAIYSYFGPYEPVSTKKLLTMLNKNNFIIDSKTKHFLIPPRVATLYQLYLQYKKSAGTTFLHRIKRENKLTKLIDFILKKQGTATNHLGSITSIQVKK